MSQPINPNTSQTNASVAAILKSSPNRLRWIEPHAGHHNARRLICAPQSAQAIIFDVLSGRGTGRGADCPRRRRPGAPALGFVMGHPGDGDLGSRLNFAQVVRYGDTALPARMALTGIKADTNHRIFPDFARFFARCFNPRLAHFTLLCAPLPHELQIVTLSGLKKLNAGNCGHAAASLMTSRSIWHHVCDVLQT